MSTKRAPVWETPPVHPAADKLPMMSDDEIEELAKDIAENGLQQPIILWRDNRDAVNGSSGPFPSFVLDGRNRLAALERLGFADPRKARIGRGTQTDAKVRTVDAVREVSGLGPEGLTTRWEPNVEPVTFVLSMNVHRRHLTAEAKRQAIRDFIEADPSAPDLKVAKALGVSPSTVGAVRDGDQNVQTGKTDHSPVGRARQVLRDNPTLTQRAVAQAAGVSQGTANKARKELEAAGEIAPRGRSTNSEHTPPEPEVTMPEPDPETTTPPRKLRAGTHDKLMAKVVELLTQIQPDGLSTNGRALHEQARGEFYRIEDGFDEKKVS
jgi:transposase-like protein